MIPEIIKTPGPDENGTDRGHCYDGPGWHCCSFWRTNNEGDIPTSYCMLFGGESGVQKHASLALRMCDNIYGVKYQGPV